MKFLLNGGVPRSIQDFLLAEGFDALRISQVGLSSAIDSKVFAFAQNEGRIIITRDKGFGDITSYPPGTHEGIIVIRDPNLGAGRITDIFKGAWAAVPHKDFAGSIAVITARGVRLRKT
ncbi:MAG: DUF5615 family PIN-like protein [Firmicutes bacterium]|nr:DUF5615 family PIN-like protein [Bacillota bacterium]